MSKYLDELTGIADAQDAFNKRTEEIHEARGVPVNVPLVVTPSDAEGMAYMAQGEALMARKDAFEEKFVTNGVNLGIDPHTIE